MADVMENISIETATTTSGQVDDKNDSMKNISGASNQITSTITVDVCTSSIQEKPNNSQPHDSEYDTASDLEEDDDDEIEDGDDDEEDNRNDDVSDSTSSRGDGNVAVTDERDYYDENVSGIAASQVQKKETEEQKKVDEDRSNPQYIPKRGTFYEHDDRTAEIEGNETNVIKNDTIGIITIGSVGNVNNSASGISNSSKVTTPNNVKLTHNSTKPSTSSKTGKYWQSSSSTDQWTHDRFDAREQAPKSRAELVSAYGYDIRTEDGPPKARRKRHYGHGPNKYSRNWEDENAYLKINNKERRIPKPSDFPALNEKNCKSRKHRPPVQEEKENRIKDKNFEKTAIVIGSHVVQFDESRNRKENSDEKNEEKQKNSSRQSNVVRQAPMEFKQRHRKLPMVGVNQQPSLLNKLSNRLDATNKRQTNINANISNLPISQSNTGNRQILVNNKQSQPPQKNTDVIYNNNNNNNVNVNNKKSQDQGGYQTMQTHQPQPQPQPQLQSANQVPRSNLSQRLQNIHNHDNSSHIANVQIHSIINPSQQLQQQQIHQHQNQQQLLAQQHSINTAINSVQSQPMIQSQEQRGPPKRYSSLRRSQHDSQHISEQHHQLHHIHHLQQQVQPQLLLPEQHILQANLMQLYHQENIQVQMQALQVSQGTGINKPATYGALPPSVLPATGSQSQPQPGSYSNSTVAPAGYYVPPPDVYGSAMPAQLPQNGSFVQQASAPNFMSPPQAVTSSSMGYGNVSNSAQTPVTAYGHGTSVGVMAQTGNVVPAPSNYQNYNTVGGTTYFVPPPSQASARPVILPQRRPTNAIPILPPTDKNFTTGLSGRTIESKEEPKSQIIGMTLHGTTTPPIGSAENIDHIIDNMFMQRPAIQPIATATVIVKNNNLETTSTSDINFVNNVNNNNTMGISQKKEITENNSTDEILDNSKNNINTITTSTTINILNDNSVEIHDCLDKSK